MPVSLPLQNYQHYTLSDARLGVLTEYYHKSSGTLDFTDESVRESARQVISHMGPIDKFMDWLFHGEAKRTALLAMADLFIMLRKEELGPLTAEESATRSLAHQKLIASLSEEGRKVFLIDYDEIDGGVQFNPRTGNWAFDSIFTITLSHAEAGELIEQATDPLQAARVYGEWALRARSFAERAQLHVRQALALERGKDYWNALSAWKNCAGFAEPGDVDERFIELDDVQDRERVARYAATAWSRAHACAEALGDMRAVAEAAEQLNKYTDMAERFKAYSYRAEALQSKHEREVGDRPDSFIGRESHLYRLEAKTWTGVGDVERAVQAWKRFDEACQEHVSALLDTRSVRARLTAEMVARNAATSLQRGLTSPHLTPDSTESLLTMKGNHNTQANKLLNDRLSGLPNRYQTRIKPVTKLNDIASHALPGLSMVRG